MIILHALKFRDKLATNMHALRPQRRTFHVDMSPIVDFPQLHGELPEGQKRSLWQRIKDGAHRFVDAVREWKTQARRRLAWHRRAIELMAVWMLLSGCVIAPDGVIDQDATEYIQRRSETVLEHASALLILASSQGFRLAATPPPVGDWRADLRAFPYTPPTGIDAYGRGTIFNTAWNLAGQTGTVHTVTTTAQMTTAVSAAVAGDKIVIAANFIAPSDGWNLGNKSNDGSGHIYIVSDYINNGTFERRASVDDWSTLTPLEWATEINACRARKGDTYRTIQTNAASGGNSPVFRLTQAKGIWWHLAGVELKMNTAGTGENSGLISVFDTSEVIPVSTAAAPGRIICDRVRLTALPTQNLKRGFRPYGSQMAFINGCMDEIHASGTGDSSAVDLGYGENMKLVNNTLEATGVTVISGGIGTNEAMHPRHIEIRACHLISPLGVLAADAAHAASPWSSVATYQQKTILEAKYIKQLWCEGVTLENARGGFPFIAGYSCQPNAALQQAIIKTKDLAFRQMRAINSPSGITIGGLDNSIDPLNGLPEAPGRHQWYDLLATKIGSTNGELGRVCITMGVSGGLELSGLTFDTDGGATDRLSQGFVFNDPAPNEPTSGSTWTIRGLVLPSPGNAVRYGGVGNGDEAVSGAEASGGTVDWQNNSVMWSSTFNPSTTYNGRCPLNFVATRNDVGFDNAAAGDYDITGTHADAKCNAALVRLLTDANRVETY